MQTFVRPSLVPKAKDVFTICDLPELAARAAAVPANDTSRKACRAGRDSWTGGKSYETSVEQVRSGDMAGVAASDALLDKLETESFVTPMWRNRLDVVGGIPNVPAFLAGHPMNMRRRERVMTEQGPLMVLASMELSAGISVATMRKRGAAILALVRLLSGSRPVELYACCTIGNYGTASHVLVRIDTAPLDLARAAHVMTCPSVTRGVMYATCADLHRVHLGETWSGGWAYGNHDKYRKTALDSFKAALGTSAEALLIPAAHVNDQCVNDPIAWLKTMLAQYGGAPVAE